MVCNPSFRQSIESMVEMSMEVGGKTFSLPKGTSYSFGTLVWDFLPREILDPSKSSLRQSKGDPIKVRLKISGDFSSGQPRHNSFLSPSPALQNMWDDMEFSDFKVVARGGEKIPCHRSILAAATPVFKGMMSGDMEEGRQGFVIVDEPVEALRAMLRYMYLGQLACDVEHTLLLDLLRLSDYYQVDDLARLCVSRLLPLIDKDNVVEIMQVLGHRRHVSTLFEKAFLYVEDMVRSNDELFEQLSSRVTYLSSEAGGTPHEGNYQEEAYSQQNQSRQDASLLEKSALALGIANNGDESEFIRTHSDTSKIDGRKDEEGTLVSGPSHAQTGSFQKTMEHKKRWSASRQILVQHPYVVKPYLGSSSLATFHEQSSLATTPNIKSITPATTPPPRQALPPSRIIHVNSSAGASNHISPHPTTIKHLQSPAPAFLRSSLLWR